VYNLLQQISVTIYFVDKVRKIQLINYMNTYSTSHLTVMYVCMMGGIYTLDKKCKRRVSSETA